MKLGFGKSSKSAAKGSQSDIPFSGTGGQQCGDLWADFKKRHDPTVFHTFTATFMDEYDQSQARELRQTCVGHPTSFVLDIMKTFLSYIIVEGGGNGEMSAADFVDIARTNKRLAQPNTENFSVYLAERLLTRTIDQTHMETSAEHEVRSLFLDVFVVLVCVCKYSHNRHIIAQSFGADVISLIVIELGKTFADVIEEYVDVQCVFTMRFVLSVVNSLAQLFASGLPAHIASVCDIGECFGEKGCLIPPQPWSSSDLQSLGVTVYEQFADLSVRATLASVSQSSPMMLPTPNSNNSRRSNASSRSTPGGSDWMSSGKTSSGGGASAGESENDPLATALSNAGVVRVLISLIRKLVQLSHSQALSRRRSETETASVPSSAGGGGASSTATSPVTSPQSSPNRAASSSRRSTKNSSTSSNNTTPQQTQESKRDIWLRCVTLQCELLLILIQACVWRPTVNLNQFIARGGCYDLTTQLSMSDKITDTTPAQVQTNQLLLQRGLLCVRLIEVVLKLAHRCDDGADLIDSVCESLSSVKGFVAWLIQADLWVSDEHERDESPSTRSHLGPSYDVNINIKAPTVLTMRPFLSDLWPWSSWREAPVRNSILFSTGYGEGSHHGDDSSGNHSGSKDTLTSKNSNGLTISPFTLGSTATSYYQHRCQDTFNGACSSSPITGPHRAASSSASKPGKGLPCFSPNRYLLLELLHEMDSITASNRPVPVSSSSSSSPTPMTPNSQAQSVLSSLKSVLLPMRSNHFGLVFNTLLECMSATSLASKTDAVIESIVVGIATGIQESIETTRLPSFQAHALLFFAKSVASWPTIVPALLWSGVVSKSLLASPLFLMSGQLNMNRLSHVLNNRSAAMEVKFFNEVEEQWYNLLIHSTVASVTTCKSSAPSSSSSSNTGKGKRILFEAVESTRESTRENKEKTREGVSASSETSEIDFQQQHFSLRLPHSTVLGGNVGGGDESELGAASAVLNEKVSSDVSAKPSALPTPKKPSLTLPPPTNVNQISPPKDHDAQAPALTIIRDLTLELLWLSVECLQTFPPNQSGSASASATGSGTSHKHSPPSSSSSTPASSFSLNVDEMANLLSGGTSDDVVLQVARFLMNLVQFCSLYKLPMHPQSWANVMAKCVAMSRQQVSSVSNPVTKLTIQANTPNTSDLSALAKTRPFLWPARVAVLQLMYFVCVCVPLDQWVGIFVPSPKASQSADDSSEALLSSTTASNTSANAAPVRKGSVPPSSKSSAKSIPSLSKPGSNNNLGTNTPSSGGSKTPVSDSGGAAALANQVKQQKHAVLLRLTLDWRSCDVALFLLTRVFVYCVNYVQHEYSHAHHSAAITAPSLPIAPSPEDMDASQSGAHGSASSIGRSSIHEALLHDIIRGLMSVVKNSSRQPQYIDGFAAAYNVMTQFTAFLRDKCRTADAADTMVVDRVFNTYGVCSAHHQLFHWTHSRPSVFKDMLLSIEEALRHGGRLWSNEMKANLLRAAWSLLTALMIKSDKNKESFTQLMLQKNRRVGGGGLGSNYHDLVNIVLMAEKDVTLETILCLFQTVVGVDGFHNYGLVEFVFQQQQQQQEGTTPASVSTITTTSGGRSIAAGLFAQSLFKPPLIIENTAVLPILMTLLPHCSLSLQECICRSLFYLISSETAIVNMSRLTQMHPPMIELILDTFHKLQTQTMQVELLTLLKQLGQHSISVAQLKRIFRLMQFQQATENDVVVTNSAGEASHNVVEAAEGMNADGAPAVAVAAVDDLQHQLVQQTQSQSRQPNVGVLLDCLAGMIDINDGPKYFFHFQGSESGLMLAPIHKWGAIKGYSGSVWFCIEAANANFTRANSPTSNMLVSTLSGLMSLSAQQQQQAGTQDSMRGSMFARAQSLFQQSVQYEPVLLSLRQTNGIGIEVLLVQNNGAASNNPSSNNIQPISTGRANSTGSGQFSAAPQPSYSIVVRSYTAKSHFSISLDLKSDAKHSTIGTMRQKQWHHLAFSHSASGFRSHSEMGVMLDGVYTRERLPFPRFSEPIYTAMVGDRAASVDTSGLGTPSTNPSGTNQLPSGGTAAHTLSTSTSVNVHTAFCGEMGNIYFFSEALSEDRLAAIYALGPAYSQLFYDVDSHLSNALMLTINPGVSRGENNYLDNTPDVNSVRWLSGQSVEKSSSALSTLSSLTTSSSTSISNAASAFTGAGASTAASLSAHTWGSDFVSAVALKGTFRCTTRDMRNTLDCLGGLKALLPLFAQVDVETQSQSYGRALTDSPGLSDSYSRTNSTADDNICLKILNLIFDLLRDSAENRTFMSQHGGFALVAYFLERIHPRHLTQSVCECLVAHTYNLTYNIEWQDSVIRHILCCFKIWIHTEVSVQCYLLSVLCRFARENPGRFVHIVSVQKLLDELCVRFVSAQSRRVNTPNAATTTAGAQPATSTEIIAQPIITRQRSNSNLYGSAHNVVLNEHDVTALRSDICEIIYTEIMHISNHPGVAIGGAGGAENSVPTVCECIQQIIQYVLNESFAPYKVNGLQLLMRIIAAQSSNTHSSSSLAQGQALTSKRSLFGLLSLMTHARSKVRLYALLAICSLVQVVVSKLQHTQFVATSNSSSSSLLQPETPMTERQQAKRSSKMGNLSARLNYGSIRSNASSSAPSTPQHGHGGIPALATATHTHFQQSNDPFESAIGVSSGTLTHTFVWIVNTLTQALTHEFGGVDVLCKHTDIIFCALHLTMHGLPCKNLVGLIETLYPQPASAGSSNGGGERSSLAGPSLGQEKNKPSSYSFSADELKDWSVSSGDKVCLPSMLVCVSLFAQSECVPLRKRLKFFLCIKTSLQSFDNYEACLSVYGWQTLFFQALLAELSRKQFLLQEQQLQSLIQGQSQATAQLSQNATEALTSAAAVSTTPVVNKTRTLSDNNISTTTQTTAAPQLANAHSSTASAIEEIDALCEVIMSIICDVHVHAVCFGVPAQAPTHNLPNNSNHGSMSGRPFAQSPGETVYDRAQMLSAKSVCEELALGTRVVGAIVLRETMLQLHSLISHTHAQQHNVSAAWETHSPPERAHSAATTASGSASISLNANVLDPTHTGMDLMKRILSSIKRETEAIVKPSTAAASSGLQESADSKQFRKRILELNMWVFAAVIIENFAHTDTHSQSQLTRNYALAHSLTQPLHNNAQIPHRLSTPQLPELSSDDSESVDSAPLHTPTKAELQALSQARNTPSLVVSHSLDDLASAADPHTLTHSSSRSSIGNRERGASESSDLTSPHLGVHPFATPSRQLMKQRYQQQVAHAGGATGVPGASMQANANAQTQAQIHVYSLLESVFALLGPLDSFQFMWGISGNPRHNRPGTLRLAATATNIQDDPRAYAVMHGQSQLGGHPGRHVFAINVMTPHGTLGSIAVGQQGTNAANNANAHASLAGAVSSHGGIRGVDCHFWVFVRATLNVFLRESQQVSAHAYLHTSGQRSHQLRSRTNTTDGGSNSSAGAAGGKSQSQAGKHGSEQLIVVSWSKLVNLIEVIMAKARDCYDGEVFYIIAQLIHTLRRCGSQAGSMPSQSQQSSSASSSAAPQTPAHILGHPWFKNAFQLAVKLILNERVHILRALIVSAQMLVDKLEQQHQQHAGDTSTTDCTDETSNSGSTIANIHAHISNVTTHTHAVSELRTFINDCMELVELAKGLMMSVSEIIQSAEDLANYLYTKARNQPQIVPQSQDEGAQAAGASTVPTGPQQSQTSAIIEHVLLHTIKSCLVNKYEQDKLMGFCWCLWEQGLSFALTAGKQEEEVALPARLTDIGLHKNVDISDILLLTHGHTHPQTASGGSHSANCATCIYLQDFHRHMDASANKALQLQQLRLRENVRSEDANKRKVAHTWNEILEKLANERGPWGTGTEDANEILWTLDPRESFNRCKTKLIRNRNGSRHTQISALSQVYEDAELTVVEAISLADRPSRMNKSSQELWRDLMKYKYITAEAMSTAQAVDDELQQYDNKLDMVGMNVGMSLDDGEPDPDDVFYATNNNSSSNNNMVSTGARADKVLFEREVRVVVPSTNSMSPAALGTLCLTKSKLSFTRFADVDSNNNVSAAATTKKLEIFACQPFSSTQWQTRDIHDALLRHYNLQPVAVEVFFLQRDAVFFEFDTPDYVTEFLQILRHKVRPPHILPALGKLPKSIMAHTMHGQNHITAAWVNREITNFEYLMKLNTIAGRTFNDLGQYPVFPWVLANYVTAELDLRDPNNYRDLRYPVGAQTPDNRALVSAKYRELERAYQAEEGGGGLPPFHFGSHYSVAGFVLWYLMRLEPYTSLHIQLQDGRFDKPDRMFTSLAATWRGCTTNTSDVKELIPEMFYCPELLTNINNIDFGKTQAGKKVSEVALPPWANGSIHEFMYLHREALESEFVSLNLHNWIDLIFGYKQRPPHLNGHADAVESCNVFFHLTYANAVNLQELKRSDPTLYSQYICQITEFGQTPQQLFDRPHAQRLPLHVVDVIWPIASVVRGVDTIMSNHPKYIPIMPKRIVCKKGAQISVNPLLFIMEYPGDKLVTVDTHRIVGNHFWQVVSPDVVPPFKFKVDEAALELSQGKIDKRQRGVERRLGVPFAASASAHTVSAYSFDSSGSNASISKAALAQRWRPIKIKQYIKIDQGQSQMRRHTPIAAPVSATVAATVAPVAQAQAQVHAEDALPASTGDRGRANTIMTTAAAVGPAGTSTKRSSKTATMLMLNEANLNTHTDNTSPRDRETDRGGRDRSASEVSLASTQGKRASTGTPSGPGGPSTPASLIRPVCVSEDHLSAQLFAPIADHKLLVSCGHWDHSFRVTAIDSGRLVQVVNQHSDVVTCAAYARDSIGNAQWLVTGSRDCTIMVWEVCGGDYSHHGHLPIPPQPLHILYGHDDAVTAVALQPDFDLVLSGSDDGTVMVHSLRTGVYIRSILLSNVQTGSALPPMASSSGVPNATVLPPAPFSNPKPAATTAGPTALTVNALTSPRTPVVSAVVDGDSPAGVVATATATTTTAGPATAAVVAVSVSAPVNANVLHIDESAVTAVPQTPQAPVDETGNVDASSKSTTQSKAQIQNPPTPYSQTPTPMSQQPSQPAASSQAQLQSSSTLHRVSWVGISREGYLCVYCGEDQLLLSYATNGDLLAVKLLPEKLYAFALSEDGKVLVTGGDSCLVVLRWLRNLELANDGPRRGLEAVLDGSSEDVGPFTAPIRSLYLTRQERLLLVGLETGELRQLAQDSDYLRQRLQRKLKEIGIL